MTGTTPVRDASSFTMRRRNVPTVSNSVENSERDITISSTSVSVETVADDMLAAGTSMDTRARARDHPELLRRTRLEEAESQEGLEMVFALPGDAFIG